MVSAARRSFAALTKSAADILCAEMAPESGARSSIAEPWGKCERESVFSLVLSTDQGHGEPGV